MSDRPVQDKNPERVYWFLRERTPEAICNACIAEGTGIGTQSVNPWTGILSLTSDFDKKHGTCSVCQREKNVTRSLRYA